MSDEEPTRPDEDTSADPEPEPEHEEAYPALEFNQLSESDHGEHGAWSSLDDE